MKPHHYKITISDISDGEEEAFEAYVPAFNSHHFGQTIQEALSAYYAYFESELRRREKGGVPMPKSDIMQEKMKQVPLRIPQSLYEKAYHQAKNKGLSFNSFVAGVLEKH